MGQRRPRNHRGRGDVAEMVKGVRHAQVALGVAQGGQGVGGFAAW
jgi:hypothetical protein